jgi:hypothetical protein
MRAVWLALAVRTAQAVYGPLWEDARVVLLNPGGWMISGDRLVSFEVYPIAIFHAKNVELWDSHDWYARRSATGVCRGDEVKLGPFKTAEEAVEAACAAWPYTPDGVKFWSPH